MIIIVTHENSGFDKCSQELAKRLRVKEFHCKRYFKGSEEKEFIERLKQLTGPVHITNQNFARYAEFLKGPYIVTVHDLIRNFVDFDGELPIEKAELKLDEHFIKHAEHIISISEFTKEALVTMLEISEEKITVIPDGVDHSILNSHGPRVEGLGFTYILTVGSERPRKNLVRLVEALELVRKEFPSVYLVKAGTVGRELRFGNEWRERAEELNVPVLIVGRVSEEDLAKWYRGAALLAYPSLMEGFGLPPLEAMACGCPVVASNIPPVAEVVGSAGLLVDPEDVDDIASAFIELLESPGVCKELRAKGLKRAHEFSWDRAAEETRKVYALVENSAGIEIPN